MVLMVMFVTCDAVDVVEIDVACVVVLEVDAVSFPAPPSVIHSATMAPMNMNARNARKRAFNFFYSI